MSSREVSPREPSRLRAAIRRNVSAPWAAAALAMILLIWGNSLVPGEGSSRLSLTVVAIVQGALQGLGLPSAWVTNFLVRKTAHFCEYLILGVLVSQALDAPRTARPAAIAAAAVALVCVPAIDETIQLFVDGRAGRLADVLLDCCGAATGLALRTLIVRRKNIRGKKTAHR